MSHPHGKVLLLLGALVSMNLVIWATKQFMVGYFDHAFRMVGA